MEHNQLISELRRRLSVPGPDGCAMSAEDAQELLRSCGGQLDRATYEGCLRNAENSAVTMPDVSVESQREYWLSLARHYRPNGGAAIKRADERRCSR